MINHLLSLNNYQNNHLFNRDIIKKIIVFFIALLPAFLLLFYIIKYSVNLLYWDQWSLMPLLYLKLANGDLPSFSELIYQHNESRKFFPKIIFLILAFLTKNNVRAEMLLIFFAGCLVALNIFLLNLRTIKAPLFITLLLAFLANLLIFSPAQYDNWFWGIQLVVIMPILCITTSMNIAYSSLSNRLKLILCITLAIICTYSYANGLLAWIIVLPVLILAPLKSWSELPKKIPLIVTWLIIFSLNLVFYFHDLHRPESSPDPGYALAHPGETFIFFLGFLGTPLGFFQPAQVGFNAPIIGGILITIFIILFAYIVKHILVNPHHPANIKLLNLTIAWLMLGVYAISSGVLTAVGRVGGGMWQAIASKYTTFSIYLIVAIIYLFYLVIQDYHQRYILLVNTTSTKQITHEKFKQITRLLSGFLIGLLLVLYIPNYAHSVTMIKEQYARRLEGKGCLQFVNIVNDPACIETRVIGRYDFARIVGNDLDRIGFIQPPLAKTNMIQDFLGEENSQAVYGYFDGIELNTPNSYATKGWAILPDRQEPADIVVLTYEKIPGQAVIFEIADLHSARESLVDSLKNENYRHAGWEKIFDRSFLPAGEWTIRAWAYDAKIGRAYPLQNSFVVKN